MEQLKKKEKNIKNTMRNYVDLKISCVFENFMK